MDKIQCEIIRLSPGPSTTGGVFILLLKEIDGERRLPIIIGSAEAQSIALILENYSVTRPLTHDLLKSVIDSLGAIVIEVVIDELKENTFYAKIVIDLSGMTYEIDARPSDAIALAVRTQSPIFVMEEVLAEAAFIPSDESLDDDQISQEDDEVGENKHQPNSKEAQLAALQNKLREAIEAEEYERAAKIRDDIKKLTSHN